MHRNRKTNAYGTPNPRSSTIVEAVSIIKEVAYAKYDESIDLALNLDVDPRHAEENIRITTPLPHGTGKKVSVLALVSSDAKEKEALEFLRETIESGEHFEKECQNISRDSRSSRIMRGNP
mgnify:CR=1 FL=1